MALRWKMLAYFITFGVAELCVNKLGVVKIEASINVRIPIVSFKRLDKNVGHSNKNVGHSNKNVGHSNKNVGHLNKNVFLPFGLHFLRPFGIFLVIWYILWPFGIY
jgi:hypothetical protein